MRSHRRPLHHGDGTADRGRGDLAEVDGGDRAPATIPAPAPAVRIAVTDPAVRTRRTPALMAGVTASVGLSSWGCAQIAGALAGTDAATTVGAITWIGTAAAVPILRAVLRHRIPELWRTRWTVGTLAAAVWVDAVAAAGPALLDPAGAGTAASTLILGSVMLGARWANIHDPLYAPPVVEPEPEPVAIEAAPPRPAIDRSRAAEIEADWEALVASGDNAIAPGSELQRRTSLPHGYRWLVQLRREGHVGCSDLAYQDARVALKLGVRATHVMLEPLDGDAAREDQARLTVVTRDALAGGVAYTGPEYDHGIIRIGDRNDGTGGAPWIAFNDTGVQSGVVTGGPRMGKSSLLALLGMAYRASNEWAVLFGDGDVLGRSSPLLGQVAHKFARGPAEVLRQLQALEALRYVRGPMMGTLTEGPDGKPVPALPGQKPAEKLLPCPSLHGIVWILDEFHLLANDPDLQAVNFVARVKGVVRLLAKYGVSVIISTHSAGGSDWDGDDALRGMVSQTNALALKNNNKSDQGIIDSGLYRTDELPPGGGYAYATSDGETAMIRIAHSETMAKDWLDYVLQRGTPDPRTWAVLERYSATEPLDPVADYHASQAALDAFDAAVASGAPLPGSPEERAAAAAATDEDVDDDWAGGPVSFGGFAVPRAPECEVIPIDREERAQQQREPYKVAPMNAFGALTPKDEQVLAVLRSEDRAWRSRELIEATGLSASEVSTSLGRLVGRDLAHRPTGKNGIYAVGTAPAEGSAAR